MSTVESGSPCAREEKLADFRNFGNFGGRRAEV